MPTVILASSQTSICTLHAQGDWVRSAHRVCAILSGAASTGRTTSCTAETWATPALKRSRSSSECTDFELSCVAVSMGTEGILTSNPRSGDAKEHSAGASASLVMTAVEDGFARVL